jgi:hypothetical protein
MRVRVQDPVLALETTLRTVSTSPTLNSKKPRKRKQSKILSKPKLYKFLLIQMWSF